MRADLFLKKCSIVKRRSQAKAICQRGKVLIDGNSIKAANQITPGQLMTICLPNRFLEIEILDIPKSNVSRKAAGDFYRVIRDEKRNEGVDMEG